MSRVSRYNNLAKIQEEKIWKAGLYLRLSREDDVVKNESDSISSQRALLNKFVAQNPDIQIDDFYIDDGYSGTNFDRPDFQRMLAKIKTGDIDCVIVKDLSRFGRNTIESSNYIEVIFPILKVRFISLLDNVDTFLDPNSANGLLVPFKNIMNDEYVRDLSIKVKTAQKSYMRQGLFIGAFACYGYEKNKEDRHKLVVDAEASQVVKTIYKMFLNGDSLNAIARFLNDNEILTPFEYKKSKGYKYKNPNQGKYHVWTSSTVQRILSNQMYVGDMVQGTRGTISYRNHKIIKKSSEEWCIVPNTHEPIVSREDFEKVQLRLEKNKTKFIKPFRTYILRGLVRCGDCGKALQNCLCSEERLRGKYYFRCPTYMMTKGKICTKHSIRNDVLEKLVFDIVKSYIEISVNIQQIIQKVNLKNSNVSSNIEKEHIKLDNELKSLKESLNILYIKFKSGEMTENDYLKRRDDATQKITLLENQLIAICSNINKNVEIENNKFITAFAKYKGFTSLTKEMADELIKKILIYDNKHIEVEFNFQDEFEAISMYLDENCIK